MDPWMQEYFERLDAMLDAYTDATGSLTEKVDALVVSWTITTPAVGANPPSPSPSPESTTDASAPVPNASCSTTKAEELHDSNTAIADYLDLAIDLNTTTALGLKPVVDLCNTTAAIEVGTNVHGGKFGALNIPAAVSNSPLLHVQVPSPKRIPESTCRVDVGRLDEYALVAATPDIAIELAILPRVSSFINKAHEASAVLHGASLGCITMVPLTCSTECLKQDNGTLVFLPPITTVSLLPAAAPMLVTDRLHSGTDTVDPMQLVRNHDLDVSPPTRHEGLPIRPTPWPSFLMHHSAEVLELLPGLFDKPEAAFDDVVKEHKDDAKLSAITFVLNSPIWYEHFSPRDPCFVLLDAQRVIEEHMRSELHLTWQSLVGINFSELCSSRQFDSDRTLSLFPWNPGGYLLKHRNPMTMMLITASSGSHWHVTCVIEESDLCNFGVMWYLDHGSLRIKQWWLDTQCLLLVNAIFAAFFWHEGHLFGNSLQDLTICSQFQLFLSGVTSLFCMETGAASYLWDISDYFERFVACCCIIVARDVPTLRQRITHFMGNLYLSDLEGQSAICFVQPSCQLDAQNAEQMFRFSPKNVQSKLQYFACNCRAVRVWPELLRTELSNKFWNLSEHHILEHAIVCTVPMSDKLQRNIQLISLAVHQKNSSQEEFNGSVHFTRGCHLSFLLAYWTVQHIMRHCLLSEPITCEISHGYYVKILQLFAIQAIQFATVLHYSDNSIVSVMAPVVDSSNTGYFWDILSLSWMGSATNLESCECFPGNKYVAVMHSDRQLLDRVHRCRMLYNAVESNKFNCRIPVYGIWHWSEFWWDQA